MAELRVIPMGIKQSISEVGFLQFSTANGMLQPAIGKRLWRALRPARTLRREYRLRLARSQAGKISSRQIRLRQIGRYPAQNLIFLLKKTVMFTKLTQLPGFNSSDPEPFTRLCSFPTQPLIQCPHMDPEILRNHLDRHPRVTGSNYTEYIVTELSSMRSRHHNIFPGQQELAKQNVS